VRALHTVQNNLELPLLLVDLVMLSAAALVAEYSHRRLVLSCLQFS